MSTRAHVLIVGASGTFGSRLARLLARRQAFRLSLGGRDETKVKPLQAELRAIDPQGEHAFVMMDRNKVSADRLREIGSWIVVDCAGPFQGSGTALIEAAIAARCHYIDLADSRAFVADIKRFDGAARAQSVGVFTGASSTPALTHAVLATLTAGWRQIDTIDIAIVPGNRTPKGRSVVEGILSWVGQKVRVFNEGQWQERRGWSGTHLAHVEGLTPRRAALADVPDLDLLVARFQPRVRARFDAGMELWLLHWLIGLSGACVRLRLVRSAKLFTGLGTWIALRLDRFGTDSGGMVIEVTGLDQRLEPKMVRWSLRAEKGDGPYVPAIPAAATIWAVAKGQAMTGARAATGVLTIEALKPWFDGLAITTRTSSFKREVPLFARVMGRDFVSLPEVTRRLHRGRPAMLAEGEAAVVGARNAVGRLVAKLFGLPAEASRVPVRVLIESRDGREYWTRFFDGRPMRSVMQRVGDGIVEERFGPVAIKMVLVARPDGLDMVPSSGRIGSVPIPSFLLPAIKAEERTEGAHRHRFDVEIGLPLIGRLVAYRGYLEL
ncbi:MAG TPA: DUF4166 domain-containing protein [Devosia sp.]